MHLKVGIKGRSCFADVEFGTFSTTNYIYDIINMTIKLLGNIHEAFRSLDPNQGTDEGAHFILILVA